MKSLTLSRRKQWALLAPALSFLAFSEAAVASPQFGGQCTNCHQDQSALPGNHLPITNMESARCLSCHQAAQSVEPASAAPADPAPSLATATNVEPRTNEQPAPLPPTVTPQAVMQAEPEAAVQAPVAAQAVATTAMPAGPQLQQRTQAGHHVGGDPLSFRVTVGVLSSSDIDQHRSNSLFHGSSESTFYQPGAEGGGHETETDAVAGARLHFGLGANYQMPLGEGSTLMLGAGAFQDAFLEEDFTRLNTRLSVGWRKRHQNQMFRLTAYLQDTSFDGTADDLKTDYSALGARFNYQKTLADGGAIVAALHARQREYDDEADARNAEYSMSLGLRNTSPDLGRYEFGAAFLNRNNPKMEHNRYDSPSLFGSLERSLTAHTTIGVSGAIGLRTYQAADPTADEIRSDRFAEIGFSIEDDRLDVMSATPKLSCGYSQTESNIDRFDSDATYCALMLEMRF